MELTLEQAKAVADTMQILSGMVPDLYAQMTYWMNINPAARDWFAEIILNTYWIEGIVHFLIDAVEAMNEGVLF